MSKPNAPTYRSLLEAQRVRSRLLVRLAHLEERAVRARESDEIPLRLLVRSGEHTALATAHVYTGMSDIRTRLRLTERAIALMLEDDARKASLSASVERLSSKGMKRRP